MYGPFMFAKNSIICMSYLDILQLRLLPKLEENLDNTFLLQQYRSLPHYNLAVINFLYPIGGLLGMGHAVAPMFQRSYPVKFLCLQSCKRPCVIFHQHSKSWCAEGNIRLSISSVAMQMIHNVWGEITYCYNIQRVTNSAHT